MKSHLNFKWTWVSIVVLFCPAHPAVAGDSGDDQSEESIFEQESILDQEQEFPDLVRKDEVGELMDEFAFLEDELGLDEVESSSKRRQSIFWSPSAVTVLTRRDIQHSGALSITNLLRNVPGMDISFVSPFYSLVDARGFLYRGNNHVLLLVDGREEIVDMTGFAFWEALSVDLEEIERIEVIRGPGSALYGANAFNGVVNVTTVSAEPAEGEQLLLSGGELGQLRLFGRMRDRIRTGDGWLSWGLGLGGEVQRESSAREVLGRGLLRAHGRLRYQAANMELMLQAGGVSGQGNIMLNFGEMHLPTFWNLWVKTSADFQISRDLKLKTQVYYTRYLTELVYRHGLYIYGLWMANIPDLLWTSDTVDGQVQLEWAPLEEVVLVSGANLRLNMMSGGGMLLESDQEIRGAGFLQASWQASDAIQLTGGIRVDFNSVTPLAVSPRAVLVLRPWEKHAFRVGYGLAFRKPCFLESQVHLEVEDYNPSFPEIVQLFAEQIGNPGLENMKVHVVEAGWRTHLLDDRLQLSVDLFLNKYHDFIAMNLVVPIRLGLPDLSNAYLGYVNMGSSIWVMGSELAAVWAFHPGWKVWINWTLRTFSEFDEKKFGLNHGPASRLNLGFGYSPTTGLSVNLSASHSSAYSTPLIDPADPVQESYSLPAGNSMLLQGQVGYRIALGQNESLELGAIIRTPLTGRSREWSGVPMPDSMVADNRADSGGKPLVRLVQFYLRSGF